MVVGFDLQRAVGNPVPLGKQFARPIQNCMRISAGGNHQVRSRDLHLRRQRPHVQIVHVDNTADPSKLGLQLGQIQPRRRSLHQHSQRLPAELPRPRQNEHTNRRTESTHDQPVIPHTIAATITPTDPSMSDSTSR